MQGYKELAQSDEPTLKPKPLGDESPCNGVHRPKALRVLLCILLLINAGLLVANAGASASMRASLAQILPVHDPRKLARPDQYIGIPETSRYKTVVLRDEDGNLVYPTEERKRGAGALFAGMEM
ncbi:unnamed protein product [Peniophora sp. CBMAI 1063]|nr:unnamed protein product [Peniophora sp. CBMAI 1063]